MIIVFAEVQTVSDGCWSSRQTLKFPDQQMPRVGEFVRLGEERYIVTSVEYKFRKDENARNTLIGENFFFDYTPGAEIVLKPVGPK
jgi:hypothetical protein